MILALFGPSCSGKTTIARHASARLNIGARFCGEAAKLRARLLDISVGSLSDDEHRAVDEETRRWALASDPCIVEGRYLDYVLSMIRQKVTLVRLDATVSDRNIRRGPADRALTIPEDEPDLSDATFCARVYSSSSRIKPDFVLNTSELSVDVCVQRVISVMRGPALG
jgi:hypothetical protein